MRRRTFVRTILAGLAGSVAAATLRLPAGEGLAHAAVDISLGARQPTRQAESVRGVAGRLIAVGIDGASAVCAIGQFHPGSPFRDNPKFAAETEAGKILDPARLFVASGSNFGAPTARPDFAPGAILSIDPRRAETLVIPAAFAAADGQVAALDGMVQLYAAQSPAFLNGFYNAAAVTADFPSVSAPQGISLNNAFGRPWFTNVPATLLQPGFESVTDPDGRPLAGAPSVRDGGIFAARMSDREPEQLVPGGLDAGVIATALLGRSPDGGPRAVFAAVTADGAVVQIHVEKGIDGLAPPGTMQALPDVAPMAAEPAQPTRTGILFNWVPNKTLFVADPLGNAVVVLDFVEDGPIFKLTGTRRIALSELALPIDIAPAVPEVVNPAFSSNTTLAGSSDLYVANRANGTIARVRQDGTLVEVRAVELSNSGPIGPNRLNGIAVSPDAARIYVTVSGAMPSNPDAPGALVELPAFGAA
jgi:hypothetical protein